MGAEGREFLYYGISVPERGCHLAAVANCNPHILCSRDYRAENSCRV
jgi:hypothetical protein